MKHKTLFLAVAASVALGVSGCSRDQSAAENGSVETASDANASSDAGLDYTTLDTEPAPILSPSEALDAFKIAPGFEIELVASEPLVDTPVAMVWDEFSRLYVVEMRSYMPNVDGEGKDDPVGQITRLTDTDNDGKMDKSEVFLDKLVNPRAVAGTRGGRSAAHPRCARVCVVRPERTVVGVHDSSHPDLQLDRAPAGRIPRARRGDLHRASGIAPRDEFHCHHHP